MNVNEFLNQFLTIDNQHFKKRHKENPIELQDFYKILKWYLKFNSDNNLIIADVNDNYKQFGWVYIRDNSNLYRINADTKLKGLKTI